MTATIQAPPLTETGAVARARAVLAVVWSDSFPWPSAGGTLIGRCAEDLRDGLETLDDLLSGRIHPAAEFPELACPWPHDALGQAVAKVTQDIDAGTGDLAEVIRRFCGDEAADSVVAAAAEGER